MARQFSQFFSRRNRVGLVDDGVRFVRKEFACADCCAREAEFYQKYQAALPLPQLLAVGARHIDLEYIEGELVADILTDGDAHRIPHAARLVGDFLKKLCQTAVGFCPADTNLRNYILRDGVCYGVDFEEIIEGDLTLAVAKMIAFVGLYDLDAARITAFCTALADCTSFDLQKHSALCDKEAQKVIARRKK